jgi:hypothetical protein
MAGRIGSVQRAQDGSSYGFVLYDAQERACIRRRPRGAGSARLAGDGVGLRTAVRAGNHTLRMRACSPAADPFPGGLLTAAGRRGY